MFGNRENITIKVKLYSGLDHHVNMTAYDPDSGIALQIAKGARLKKVLKKLGLSPHQSAVGFINGKKSDLSDTVNDGDVVYFMKPVSGG